jgi:hypothetical protein
LTVPAPGAANGLNRFSNGNAAKRSPDVVVYRDAAQQRMAQNQANGKRENATVIFTGN